MRFFCSPLLAGIKRLIITCMRGDSYICFQVVIKATAWVLYHKDSFKVSFMKIMSWFPRDRSPRCHWLRGVCVTCLAAFSLKKQTYFFYPMKNRKIAKQNTHTHTCIAFHTHTCGACIVKKRTSSKSAVKSFILKLTAAQMLDSHHKHN